MKHDSLNLTAPHTTRELAQSETEAGAMRADRIATMFAEDAYLDRGDIGKPITGDLISREAAIILVREALFGDGLGAELVMHVEHALWTLPSQMKEAA